MDIVLVNPEIPQNTGSIARTCAATRTPLHLVGKLGFDISEKAVRRAGLDYWPHVLLHQHPDFNAYRATQSPRQIWCFTKFATQSHYAAQYSPGDALVFGSETKGLGRTFLDQFPQTQWVRIPMDHPEVRSLNLSNAVAIALYEARRQLGIGI